MPDLPTGALTFVFTDIAGSTLLWDRYPVSMRDGHTRHLQIIVACVESHGGIFVRTRGEGDSTFSVFTSAPAAVAAACDFQRALASEAWPTEATIRVRAALHTGVGHLFAGDYNSTDVNRCARLRAIAHGGQTLLSNSTYQLVQAALPPDVTLIDMGQHGLKDLLQPEHVWQLHHPDLRIDFPPLLSLNTLPNNLPRQLSSFIGRKSEMAEIELLLCNTALLTLTGIGGAGKTRLALQVAADVLDRYRDGVWLVDLAALSDSKLILQTISGVLGLREEAGRPLMETLIGYLAPRRLLLLLDNCEHLIQMCAILVAALLQACPHLTILATSRETFKIAGEQVWRVPSLLPPDPESLRRTNRALDVALFEFDSVQLFFERAKQHLHDFTINRENAIHVAQLCQHLDGIPLAIELAAARVGTLPLEVIAARLHQRFHILNQGNRNAPPRHQTLRALIDWSYDLLTDRERQLLHRLCIFVGGWTLDAVEQICAEVNPSDLEIKQEEVMDLLSSLVDKSLVVMEKKEGRSRYRLLETIRQYLLEIFDNRADEQSLLIRRLAYYKRFVQHISEQYNSAEVRTLLQQLEDEHDNIRVVLDWCLNTNQPDAGLEMGINLCHFWSWSGYRTEARSRLQQLRAHPSASMKLRDFVFTKMAASSFFDFDDPQVRPTFQEILVRQQVANDLPGLADTLGVVGIWERDHGELEQARHFLEWGLRIHQAVSNPISVAWAYTMLARVIQDQGDQANAGVLFRNALDLFESVPSYEGIGWISYFLAYRMMMQYEPSTQAQLIEMLEASFEALRTQGSLVGMIHARILAGDATLRLQDVGMAHRYYQEALELMEGGKVAEKELQTQARKGLEEVERLAAEHRDTQ